VLNYFGSGPNKHVIRQAALFVASSAIFLGCLLNQDGYRGLAAQTQSSPGNTERDNDIVLKWLGVAGWEITFGTTTILIDPFLTRKEARHGQEWKTDEEAVLSAIKRADYIFAGHSHADHIADIPFIAKRFGAKVIGSRTTTNIAISTGVDKARLITIAGGEKLDFPGFSVQVIESEHGIVRRGGRIRRPKFEEITQPWTGPITGDAFVEGGCYIYYFTFGGRTLLHQSSGGFVEEKLAGLRPDMALLYPMNRTDTASFLKAAPAKTVIVHHFDQWRAPFAEGMPPASIRRAQRFARDVKGIDKQIKMIVPDFLESYPLD
jgi:L-ascorbate metabolism protein UlaG (beta-lactamase superfamily)